MPAVNGNLEPQASILARCDGLEDLKHNEWIKREMIQCDLPAFFTVATIINVMLPRQGGSESKSELNCRCPYEATTCPRTALLRLSEVYIIVVSKIDHYMDRRQILRTLNPKIPSFKVIAWLLVFYADDSSRAHTPFLHRLSHAKLFF